MVLRPLPWCGWCWLFCDIYVLGKFCHNTHKLYEPGYVCVNAPWHKILVHTQHRDILCFCWQHSCQYLFMLDMWSSRHLMTEWIGTELPAYLYFNSIRHCNVEILPTWYACVAHKYQDIFFQTQKTIPTLTHDIAPVHKKEVFYRHFESHKTTLSPILHLRRHQQTCVALSIDNFLPNQFAGKVFPEYYHSHSCLSTTDPCLLFKGLMPNGFVVYLDDLFLTFFVFFADTHKHMHTYSHSGAALNFIGTLRDFGLISVWCLPRSDIIEMSARVARLSRTGTSTTLHIS